MKAYQNNQSIATLTDVKNAMQAVAEMVGAIFVDGSEELTGRHAGNLYCRIVLPVEYVNPELGMVVKQVRVFNGPGHIAIIMDGGQTASYGAKNPLTVATLYRQLIRAVAILLPTEERIWELSGIEKTEIVKDEPTQ